MINFKMNMPFYLMVFYGSIMIAVVLLLRALLRNRLPKFVFPALWSVILLRLLVPFSLSSPFSMKVPAFSSFLTNVWQENEQLTIAEDEAVTYDSAENSPSIPSVDAELPVPGPLMNRM